MKIESYEIRNSHGIIDKIEKILGGWLDHASCKLLNDAEKDDLIVMYKSFDCTVETIIDTPVAIPAHCVSIEIIRVTPDKEILVYTMIRIVNNIWKYGCGYPSIGTTESKVMELVHDRKKLGEEVRYFDNQSKRIKY